MPDARNDAAPPVLDERIDTGAIDAALSSARSIDDFGLGVAATLAWAVEVGRRHRLHRADASARQQWSLLAAVANVDVAAARVLEPHLDALGILREAGDENRGVELGRIGADESSSWGVFAAEGGPSRLRARHGAGGWTLHGTKPWCSLAAHLTHALVTAWVDDDTRRLFAVALGRPTVSPHAGPWHSRGLAQIVSAAVDFDGAEAVSVGEDGWYLNRSGFARGGIGVAACWWGGAAALRGPLLAAAQRDGADQLALVHLARVDTGLWAAREVLNSAAASFDGGHLSRADAGVLAARVRTVVAGAAESALSETARALGPLPLVADEAHARRVADLQIYLRQHHGERDIARIGRDLVAGEGRW